MRRLLPLLICIMLVLTSLTAYAETHVCAVCKAELSEERAEECRAAGNNPVVYICEACAKEALSQAKRNDDKSGETETSDELEPVNESVLADAVEGEIAGADEVEHGEEELDKAVIDEGESGEVVTKEGETKEGEIKEGETGEGEPGEGEPGEGEGEPSDETDYVTVSFFANGGNGSMESVQIPLGSSYVLPKCGFTHPYDANFGSWGITGVAGGGSHMPGDRIESIDSDLELYPHWVWTCEFYGNGADSGSMSTMYVEDGTEFTVPDCAFGKTGHVFVCWRMIGVKGMPRVYPGDTLFAGSPTELEAEWAVDTICDIRLEPNDGKGTIVTMHVDFGTEFAAPECPFTAPEGTDFAYWTIADDEDETRYFVGDMILADRDMELDAHYIEKAPVIYVISFDAGDGTGTMDDVEVSVFDEEEVVYKIPASEFTAPDGELFTYWTLRGDFETEYLPGDKIVVNKDMTLIANYTESVTIKFKANGGDGSMSSVKVPMDTKYKAPKCKFTAPSGKTFYGWKIKDGDDKLIKPGKKIFVTEDIVLVAQWTDESDVPKTGDPRNNLPLLLGFALLCVSAVCFAASKKRS